MKKATIIALIVVIAVVLIVGIASMVYFLSIYKTPTRPSTPSTPSTPPTPPGPSTFSNKRLVDTSNNYCLTSIFGPKPGTITAIMVDCSKTNLNKWDYRSDGALVLANVSFLKSDLTFYIGDILPPNAISSDMQWDITSDGKIKSRSKGLCIGYVTCPNASACLITLTDCSNAISFTISD